MKIDMLLIGAGRSGTTSLVQYLRQHPDICFSQIKELHYFTFKDLYSRGNQYISQFFNEQSPSRLNATSDTYAMINEETAARAYAHNPDMKIMAILREPVSRAYSNFKYSQNNGYIRSEISFDEAFRRENQWIEKAEVIDQNNLGNFHGSLYYKHLEKWIKYFPKTQILILKTQDLKEYPSLVLNQITSFLGLSNYKQIPKNIHTNKAARAKNLQLQQLLNNRELPIRKVLRNCIPGILKKTIIRSEIIHKIKDLNKKEASYSSLSQEEENSYAWYFEEDKKKLKDEFGIDL